MLMALDYAKRYLVRAEEDTGVVPRVLPARVHVVACLIEWRIDTIAGFDMSFCNKYRCCALPVSITHHFNATNGYKR